MIIVCHYGATLSYLKDNSPIASYVLYDFSYIFAAGLGDLY